MISRIAITLSIAVTFVASVRATTLKVPADFATVQAALDAAGAGDEVLVSKGHYVGFGLSNAVDVTIRAKGKVVIDDVLVFAPAGLANILNCTNVRLIGFRFATPAGFVAIRFDDCIGCTIENCRTTGGANGIRSLNATNLTVDGCKVSDCTGDAITVTGVSAFIRDCEVSNAAATGIVTTLTTVEITNCTVKGTGAEGIVVQSGSASAFITDNVVEDAGTTAIDFGAPTGAGTIAGNQVKNGAAGYLGLGAGASVIDNRFTSCAGTALSVQGPQCLTSGNRAKKCNAGMFVGNSCDGGIHTGNKFTKSVTIGVEVEAGTSENLFIANTAKQSGTVDLFDHSGGNHYIDNDFPTSA